MTNVKDFGAVGDGIALDTAAIQAAIDAGGEVRIPRGNYRVGTLYLKSFGGLYLESGATLIASHNREDYNADDFCPQNTVFKAEHYTGAHLIVAVGQEHIFIKGEGVIDGQSHHWMNEQNCEEGSITFAANDKRPGQMIFLCECKNVQIQDVTLRHGSFWHLFLHGCEDVQVRGITVDGELRQYTNDGIDIDCCRRVTVSDCIIRTGDDGITLRGNDRVLSAPQVCEDITVTNCILQSYGDYGIRIGVGKSVIRNALFSNIRIFGSQNGIGITSCFSAFAARPGVLVENVQFDGMFVDALRPLEMRVVSDERNVQQLVNVCGFRNVTFNRVHLSGKRNAILRGFDGGICENIRFIDCSLTMGGKGGNTAPRDERGMWDAQTADSAFVMANAQNVLFERFTLSFTEDAVGWQAGMKQENCTVKMENCAVEKGVV